MADERPSIELYMYSFNQEFPVDGGHATFLKRRSEPRAALGGSLRILETVEASTFSNVTPDNLAGVAQDWSVQWLGNNWITNYDKIAGMGQRDDPDPLARAMMREEDFGAIVFEPHSDQVFKLNASGAKLFRHLQQRHKSGQHDLRATVPEFGDDDVQTFVGRLEELGLRKTS